MRKGIFILLAVLFFSFKTNEEAKTVTLKITLEQANTILKALSKLPYEESAVVINEIQKQAQKQLIDSTK